MNKKYIKRQLTLHKLGIPISEDVQEYVDLFNELIGDPNSLTKEYGEYFSDKGYLYSKNDVKILFYDEENEIFYLDYDNIWKIFDQKFRLNHNEISNLFTCLLEEAFKCMVTTADHNIISYNALLEEAFKCMVTTAEHERGFFRPKLGEAFK